MSTPPAMDDGRFPASFPTIRRIPAITNSSPMQRMIESSAVPSAFPCQNLLLLGFFQISLYSASPRSR